MHIRDTLSNDLDFSTLQTVATSHQGYLLTIASDKTRTPAKTVATWVFDAINLEYAAHNEPASHGFVQFSVRPKPNVRAGSQVDNAAQIVFDYNVPVVTNTATVRVAAVTGTQSSVDHKLVDIAQPNECDAAPKPI